MKSSSHFLLWAVIFIAAAACAEVTYRAGGTLPTAGGVDELIGDAVPAGVGVAAVFSKPAGDHLDMDFLRLGPDAELLAMREHSIAPQSFYEPAIGWNGTSFLVVASIHTQAVWLQLSEAGDLLAGPTQLPGLPSGDEAGRTAAFRILWLGDSYAVFGLWLEKEFPAQDLATGNFYTHLMYWHLGIGGEVLARRELAQLAPITYGDGAGVGAEKNYYDVVFTGSGFFVAYYAESQSGPPLSVYYRLYDLAGNEIRAEQPLFAYQPGQGPRLAWSGRSVAATALKTIPFPNPGSGNYMYLRCFAPDGTPLGDELEYGNLFGFGPVVTWANDKFLTAYCVQYDPVTLGYALMLTPFSPDGGQLATEYPLRTRQGTVVLGRMALGFDLELLASGNVIYGKAQDSDDWAIQNQPLLFTIDNDFTLVPPLTISLRPDAIRLAWPANAPDFKLQHNPALDLAGWTDVAEDPMQVGDFNLLDIPLAGHDPRGFFRLRER